MRNVLWTTRLFFIIHTGNGVPTAFPLRSRGNRWECRNVNIFNNLNRSQKAWERWEWERVIEQKQ